MITKGVARVQAAAPIGFNGALIEVECDAKAGLPLIQIVGMGNKSIDEARQRVRSAILNSSLDFPARKIVVNLAPAELRKDGTYLDLPIALSVLVVSGQIRQSEVNGAVFVGELALDGTLRPIRGVINMAETAYTNGYERLYAPLENVQQAQLVPGIEVIGIQSLRELYLHLKGERIIPPREVQPSATPTPVAGVSFDDITGQEAAKRAALIACAGHHNLLLTGPPGTGKTLIAHAIQALLPPLSADEALEVTKLHNLAGQTSQALFDRPFRTPHHSASQGAIIGTGSGRPGEISLAHRGVLFLDELPEFSRDVLEALRQPLEDKQVTISRASGQFTYPADFMLIAAMNPCPCGYYGDATRSCTCSAPQLQRYQLKLSGPLTDRIDLRVTVSRVPTEQLSESSHVPKSLIKSQQLTLLETLLKANEQQFYRYKSRHTYNGNLSTAETKRLLKLSPAALQLLQAAAKKLDVSPRSYFKIIRVARTIADLARSKDIESQHIAEALQFR